MNQDNFSKTGINLSTENFCLAEAKMGKIIPEELKIFLLAVNGGVPKMAYLPVDDGEFLWVKRFLSLIDSLCDTPTIENVYLRGQKKHFLPSDLISPG